MWLLSVGGSLVLNILLILILGFAYIREMENFKSLIKEEVYKVITPGDLKIIVRKDEAEQKKEAELAQNDDEEEEEEKKPRFMRTIEEQESKTPPKDVVFRGERNTSLASERDSSPDGLKDLPSTDGKKKEDDYLSLFDQKAQMGDVNHTREVNEGDVPRVYLGQGGIQAAQPQTPTPPGDPTPPMPPMVNPPDNSMADPALAARDGIVHQNPNPEMQSVEQGVAQGEAGQDKINVSPDDMNESPQMAEESPSDLANRPNEVDVVNKDTATPHEQDKAVDAKPLENALALDTFFMNLPDHMDPKKVTPQKTASAAEKTGINIPQAQPSREPIYDPMFVDGGRPGYKGHAKKTRITGQMSTRGVAAANVSQTPLGQYISLFFRLLNRNWDMECKRNMDMLIPGSLKIRFILNKNGTATGIMLISKTGGTRFVQQSFTFDAIEKTKIPPMPPAVQKELGEDNIELIVNFFFS